VRIVQVSLRFDAPGGVESTVRELSKRLRAAGEDVEVYASDLYDEASWERRSNTRPEVDGVPVRRFGIRRRLVPGLTLPMMVGLIDALSRSGADVIHAHSHRYGHVLQAAAVSAKTRIPLVVSAHYHPADRRETVTKRALLRLDDHAFGWTAYRVARAVTVQSENERRLLAEFAPSRRLRLLPPGVDLEEWRRPEDDRAEALGLPPEFFLFIGRIASNKGLPHLVTALARLPPESRRPLVLMGPDWGERAGLERLARDVGVADLLRFLGHVPDRSVYRAVLRRATALVLPSEWESYGVVLLEAMAARTPVVATAVGAVPEVLGEGRYGQLVPYGDPSALAGALRRVVDEPAPRQGELRAATEHVRELDWPLVAGRFRELYREVVRGAAG
jgi:glycosyltransferase involved in cell wall biosynthesis